MDFPTCTLPNTAALVILRDLSATDLCHVALCCQSWRNAANQNALWRPLCGARGWERYGTTTGLCKEAPFVPALSTEDEDDDEDAANTLVTFPMDAVVTGSDWPELVDTCKWKEVYMKAHHLEENWLNDRCHVSVAFFNWWSGEGVEGVDDSGETLLVHNLDGDGDTLVGSISDGTVHVWDLVSGNRQHLIQVDVADKLKEALKVKNGIIAAGCKDGKIRTYSTQTGQLLQVMSGHRLAVARLFFDGETIVSTAPLEFLSESVPKFEDSDIRLWKAGDGSCRFVFSSISDDVRLLNFDFKGEMVAGAYSNQTIRLWDIKDGSCKQTIVTGDTELLSCRLGDGFTISLSTENALRKWDVGSGELLQTFDVPGAGFEDKVEAISLSEDFLITRSGMGEMNMFSSDGKLVGQTKFLGGDFFLESIYFHGNRLITNETKGGVNILWNLDKQSGFNLVKELRGMLYDDCVETEYSTAWMSDTKLAFVFYFDEEEDTPQVPKIVVHHYW